MRFWTDERVAELRQLHAKRLSMGLIAEHFGIGRNAVMGKIFRLGLCKPHSQKPRVPLHRRRRMKINTGNGRAFRGDVSIVEDVPLPPELPADAIPVAQRRTLFELEPKHCRWPYGEPTSPDFFFCGSPEADFPARSYCRFHAAYSCGLIAAPQARAA